MSPKKILVVYKKSAYQLGLKNLRRSHDFHYQTLAAVEKALKNFKEVNFDRLARGKVFDGRKFDLVVSVGGDGTFLDAARHLGSTPILGVNSAPGHSVGRFCPACPDDFEKTLDAYLHGRLKTKRIERMQVRVNRKIWCHPVLNEVLVSHAVPAAMSRYLLKVGGKSEAQRSSGLWISTAAGSTGAIKSSGGKVLPLFSKQFQYLPRELFDGHGAGYHLKGGLLPATRPVVTVQSQMRGGRLYFDGAHQWLPFHYGDVLQIFLSKCPLKVIRL